MRPDAARPSWPRPRPRACSIPQVVYGYFPANGDGNDLVIWTDESRDGELTRFRFPRSAQGAVPVHRRLLPADRAATRSTTSPSTSSPWAPPISERTAELFAADKYQDYLHAPRPRGGDGRGARRAVAPPHPRGVGLRRRGRPQPRRPVPPAVPGRPLLVGLPGLPGPGGQRAGRRAARRRAPRHRGAARRPATSTSPSRPPRPSSATTPRPSTSSPAERTAGRSGAAPCDATGLRRRAIVAASALPLRPRDPGPGRGPRGPVLTVLAANLCRTERSADAQARAVLAVRRRRAPAHRGRRARPSPPSTGRRGPDPAPPLSDDPAEDGYFGSLVASRHPITAAVDWGPRGRPGPGGRRRASAGVATRVVPVHTQAPIYDRDVVGVARDHRGQRRAGRRRRRSGRPGRRLERHRGPPTVPPGPGTTWPGRRPGPRGRRWFPTWPGRPIPFVRVPPASRS